MEQQRKWLNACAQKLSLGLVWRELQVFSKLIYRGRNQHRRDKCYQRLTRVSKDLRVYQEVGLANHVKKLIKMFLSSESTTLSITTQGSTLASKLIESTNFIIRLLDFIMDTFMEVEQRLQMSLFIPFNLLMASSLSRIWYTLRYHLLAIAETYRAVKESFLSSSKEFLPSLCAYLSKKQSCSYLSSPSDKLTRRIDDLGKAVKRTNQIALTAAVEEKRPETELSEAVTLMDFPIANQTEVNFQPMCVDGDRLNPTTGSIDREDDSLKTVAAAKGAKSTGRKRYKTRTRRRRRANVLIFQFKSGQKPVKIFLRGKKLSTLLSNKGNVSVSGAKFSHPKLLPTGAFVVSGFRLSLVYLQSRTDQVQRYFTMNGGRNAPNHSQWMEAERTILMNQRNTISSNSSTPSTCVHELQQKLTEELDSAAAMDAATESDLSLEHLRSDSLLSNKQTREQEINRTSLSDEIDDIFGALDD